MSGSVARIRQGVYWHEEHPFLHVRSTFSSRQPYATHFHECLSLGVVFKGGTELRRNNDTGAAATGVSSGQMVLLAPMEPHSCNPLGGRARGYHMFYIDAGWALGVLGAPAGSRLIIQERIIDNRGQFGAMMGLAEAVREGRADPDGIGALAGIIAANCGFCPASESKPVAPPWSQEPKLRRESFIRSFRRATGMTPAKYRHCLRLIRAREMLRSGAGVAETALACGYADQSHFHRMCVKYLSATPAQLRPRSFR